MQTCAKCSRPANTKTVERDDYGRVHDVFVCDDHEHGKKNLFPVLKISGDDDSAMVWMEKSS